MFQLMISDLNLGIGIGFILGIIFILLLGYFLKPIESITDMEGVKIEMNGDII